MRTLTTQMEWRRAFRAEWGTSPVLEAVVPQRATVRRNWSQQQAAKAQTMFHEVEVAPFEAMQRPADKRLYALDSGTVEESWEEFAGRLFGAICDHIEAAWLPDKFHIVNCSSGYDSRIMTHAVKRLVMKNGAQWFGKGCFFTFGPECKVARQILEHEGWDPAMHVMVENPAEWLHPLMGIHAGIYFNGSTPLVPMTRYWMVRVLDRVGAVPEREQCQMLSGFGSDYALLGAGEGRLERMLGKAYYAATSISLLATPFEIVPWFAYSVLRVALESSQRQAFQNRERLGLWLDPGLATFPRVTEPWPAAPDKVLSRCADAYERSWYGENCAPGASTRMMAPNWNAGDRPMARGDWWSHWTAACYCAYLLEQGTVLRAV